MPHSTAPSYLSIYDLFTQMLFQSHVARFLLKHIWNIKGNMEWMSEWMINRIVHLLLQCKSCILATSEQKSTGWQTIDELMVVSHHDSSINHYILGCVSGKTSWNMYCFKLSYDVHCHCRLLSAQIIIKLSPFVFQKVTWVWNEMTVSFLFWLNYPFKYFISHLPISYPAVKTAYSLIKQIHCIHSLASIAQK